jgi:uncharacterized protein YcbX
MPVAGTIAGLFIYPVKSCAGIALDAADLAVRGLAGDRRWMIVAPEGRFLTQRECPRLATIRPELGAGGDGLRLWLAGAGPLELPEAGGGEGPPIQVRVWRDTVAATAPSPAADAALSDFLGRAVRLVRFPPDGHRPCDPAYAPPGSHTAFADGFPLLVTSEGSLEELNAALAEPVPMGRFRPNLVLAGVPARAEDGHRRLVVLGEDGGAELLLVKRCDRCVVTTVDQATGRKTGKEPLATLARLRRNVATGGAWFGQNAVPRLAAGRTDVRLRVGDACRLEGE